MGVISETSEVEGMVDKGVSVAAVVKTDDGLPQPLITNLKETPSVSYVLVTVTFISMIAIFKSVISMSPVSVVYFSSSTNFTQLLVFANLTDILKKDLLTFTTIYYDDSLDASRSHYISSIPDICKLMHTGCLSDFSR